MTSFLYEKDSDGIVTVTMDMNGPVNAMNAESRAGSPELAELIQTAPVLLQKIHVTFLCMVITLIGEHFGYRFS